MVYGISWGNVVKERIIWSLPFHELLIINVAIFYLVGLNLSFLLDALDQVSHAKIQKAYNFVRECKIMLVAYSLKSQNTFNLIWTTNVCFLNMFSGSDILLGVGKYRQDPNLIISISLGLGHMLCLISLFRKWNQDFIFWRVKIVLKKIT